MRKAGKEGEPVGRNRSPALDYQAVECIYSEAAQSSSALRVPVNRETDEQLTNEQLTDARRVP